MVPWCSTAPQIEQTCLPGSTSLEQPEQLCVSWTALLLKLRTRFLFANHLMVALLSLSQIDGDSVRPKARDSG
jgi:hypothetical protein